MKEEYQLANKSMTKIVDSTNAMQLINAINNTGATVAEIPLRKKKFEKRYSDVSTALADLSHRYSSKVDKCNDLRQNANDNRRKCLHRQK